MERAKDPLHPPVVQAASADSILATPEVAAAAYLLIKGRVLTRIESEEPTHTLSFVFRGDAPGELEADLAAYRAGALVPAVEFARASTKLHQIIRARHTERPALRSTMQERVPA